ncbi:hypothetical protein BC832DRAFT_576962 [Gaertneriomyces semiglobifer]|nr:hypothetical protein BC832DRAFT_576962 [Gaertneriomyces semiglobifer]
MLSSIISSAWATSTAAVSGAGRLLSAGGLAGVRLSPQDLAARAPSALSLQTRGSKYPSYGGRKLPGYILPKQSRKTALLIQKLKMKFFRLKLGKSQQRPKRPRYGRDDFILSKMNV